jgi:hypothetical protein
MRDDIEPKPSSAASSIETTRANPDIGRIYGEEVKRRYVVLWTYMDGASPTRWHTGYWVIGMRYTVVVGRLAADIIT